MKNTKELSARELLRINKNKKSVRCENARIDYIEEEIIMIIKNATVYAEDFEPIKADVEIEGEKIARIGENLSGAEELDFSGLTLLPGFIDIHTHGRAGADACDGELSALQTISRSQAKLGVTSFCPTTMTVSNAELKKIFTAAAEFRGNEEGAYMHGINMEGPYISQAKKGAQNGDFVRKPSIEEFNELNAICPVSLVDVAPEAEGAFEFAAEAGKKTTVSAAHTAADYETTSKAFENGFTHTTHLFNAMTPFSHREPGVVGAVLDNNKVTAELICDGFHVAPASLRLAFRLLGEDRSVIISDSMMASGLSDGDFSLGGQAVYVRGGKALLADGTIAASTSNVFDEFKNALKFGIPFKQALKSCSINPARAIGADKAAGSIAPGKNADILAVDTDLNLKAVFIKGKQIPLD